MLIVLMTPATKLLASISVFGATLVAQAVPVTIGGFTHELNQFAGASVTTTVSAGGVSGKVWDNAVGVDQYTLGELATPQFGFDPGDTIALGNSTLQQSLTLTYGAGFTVGTGAEKYFVVYELKSANNLTPDAEGTAFQISFNGGSWVSAVNNNFLNVIAVNEYHHQVGFDLTSANFGFNVGDVINTVSIRNTLGLGDSSDPDLTFAGQAMNTSSVPEGGNTALLLLAATGCLIFLRKRFAAQ